MAKKPLLSLPINAQLVSNMQRITKALLWKGAVMIIFFGWMPEINFFQLPKLNKYCLGVELAPAHQVIKKLKMDHLWVYTLYPTSGRNGYRLKIIDKKSKSTCQLLKFWMYVLGREINIF